MTRVLILGGTDALVARTNVIPGTQVIAIDVAQAQTPSFDLVRSLDPESLPGLIFFSEELELERTLLVAMSVSARFPSIQMVLVGDYPAHVAVEAMRAGIRDMVQTDAPEARFLEIVRRAEEPPAVAAGAASPNRDSTSQVSRMITVISPKGGVGKTSIATNLAIGFAATMPQDVVLVDLDLQFGDVAATLDLAPTRTMEDALSPAAASDGLVLKTMLTVHPAGFFVLCGAESPAANEDVTGAQVHRLLQQLATQFSCVIVDTAAGLAEPTLAALEVTDDAVVVSTMDVACVRSVRREIDLLSQLGVLPASRTLALNLADRQSGMKVKDVEAVVGMPVDVVIPRSSSVQLAANHGQPLMLRKKRGGPFVKAVRSLIAQLQRTAPMADNKHRRMEIA